MQFSMGNDSSLRSGLPSRLKAWKITSLSGRPVASLARLWSLTWRTYFHSLRGCFKVELCNFFWEWFQPERQVPPRY